MDKKEQLKEYNYEDYVKLIYNKHKYMEHVITISVLLTIISVGAAISRLIGVGNLVEYGIQATVGGVILGCYVYKLDAVTKFSERRDELLEVRGIKVSGKGSEVVYEIKEEVIKNSELVSGIVKIRVDKMMSVFVKVVLVFAMYGVGVYIIDVGSIEVKYFYQILLLGFSYFTVGLFQKEDKFWGRRDVENIIKRMSILAGMYKYKEDNQLDVDNEWLDLYLELYFKKEVLYEKGDYIKEKENLIGQEKRREEYWKWLKDIRERLGNIDRNVTAIYVGIKGEK